MHQAANRLGKDIVEKTLADWELRIKAGEVPPAPPRPTGIERNLLYPSGIGEPTNRFSMI